MRQWISALAFLVVVAGIAAFAVGSVYTVVTATEVLQRADMADIDSALYADSLSACETQDAASCS